MSKIEFDSDLHIYTIAGMEYASVSTILRDVMNLWFPKGAKSKMHRGTRVHKLTERCDKGEIIQAEDFLFEDQDLTPFLNAWCEFRKFFGGTIDQIEFRVSSCTHRYAGTIDRIIRFPSGRIVVVEIKTGKPAPWHKLQTAGYATGYKEDGHAMGVPLEKIERVAVYLNEDGSFVLRDHSNPADLSAWNAVTFLYHWKRIKDAA